MAKGARKGAGLLLNEADDLDGAPMTAGAAAGAAAAAPGGRLVGSSRLTIVLLLHVGLQIVYALRVLFSVAIVPISKQYGYGAAEQGFAASGFFAGYLLLQVPGGLAATKLGGHWVMCLGVLVPSLVTLVTPWACSSLPALIACRVLTGLLEGVTYPATHALLSRWTPAHEKSGLVGAVWAGAYLGTALTLPVAGALVTEDGWQSVFFVCGGLGVAWAAAWAAFGASSPEQLGRCDPAELAYIAAHRGVAAVEGRTPWLRLLATPAVWGVSLQHFTHNYLFYMMLTEMPTYLTSIVGFNLANSGAVAVLPFLACFVGSIGGGWCADHLLKAGHSVRSIRIGFAVVAEVLPALCVSVAGNVAAPALIVVLLTLATGFSGASSASYASTYIDMAGPNAGVLLGIGNTVATVAGVLAPIVVGQLVTAPNDDATHWRYAFYVAAAISVLGALLYAALLQTEPLSFWRSDVAEAADSGEDEEEDARLVVGT